MANTNKITVETFEYYLDNYFPFYVQKNADDSFSLALKQKDIGNKSFGANSVAIGSHVVATEANQFVIGQYNEEDENALFLIGGGSDIERKNIFKVSPSGFEAKVSNNILLSNGSASLGLNQNNISLSNGDASLDLNKDSIVINGDINSSYLTKTYYNKDHSDNTYATIENFNPLKNRFDSFVGKSWEGSSEYTWNTLAALNEQIKVNKDDLDTEHSHAELINKGKILTKGNIGDYLISENTNEILTKQNFYTLIPVYQGEWV